MAIRVVNDEDKKNLYTLLCNLSDEKESIVIDAINTEREDLEKEHENILACISNAEKKIQHAKENLRIMNAGMPLSIKFFQSYDSEVDLQSFFSLLGVDEDFLDNAKSIVDEEQESGKLTNVIVSEIESLEKEYARLQNDLIFVEEMLEKNQKRSKEIFSVTKLLNQLLEGTMMGNGSINRDYVEELLVPLENTAKNYDIIFPDNYLVDGSISIIFPKVPNGGIALADVYTDYQNNIGRDIDFIIKEGTVSTIEPVIDKPKEDSLETIVIEEDKTPEEVAESEVVEEAGVEEHEEVKEDVEEEQEGISKASVESVIDEIDRALVESSLNSITPLGDEADSLEDNKEESSLEEQVEEEEHPIEAETTEVEEISTEEEPKEEEVVSQEEVDKETEEPENEETNEVGEEIVEEPTQEEQIEDILPVEDDVPVIQTDNEDNSVIALYSLDSNKVPDGLLNLLNGANEELVRKNMDELKIMNLESQYYYVNGDYSYLTDTELSSKLNLLRGKYISDSALYYALRCHYLDGKFEDISKDIEYIENKLNENNQKGEKIKIDSSYLPLLRVCVKEYFDSIDKLNEYGIEPDDNEKLQYRLLLARFNDNVLPDIIVLKEYGISLLRKNGKYELGLYAKNPLELVQSMDDIIEAGEEDLVNTVPEVLKENTDYIVSIIHYLKRNNIEYKDGDTYADVVYKPMAFREKYPDVKLDALENISDSNAKLSKLLANKYCTVLIQILEKYYQNPESYKTFELNADEIAVCDQIKKVFETEMGASLVGKNTYKVNDVYVSRNKFERNLNYLVSGLLSQEQDVMSIAKEVLLVSALFNSRKEEGKIVQFPGIVNKDNSEVVQLSDVTDTDEYSMGGKAV